VAVGLGLGGGGARTALMEAAIVDRLIVPVLFATMRRMAKEA
jgi:hypothetical protein